MRSLSLDKVYQKLEPGPVVLVTTADGGRFNVMTMSWHMMVEFDPPLIACVVSEANFSHRALKETGECVIAIPPADLADTVVAHSPSQDGRLTTPFGNCSGREVDKFARFGLTALPGHEVSAPRIAQCIVNIECRVVDRALVARYNLFIVEAVKAWIDPERARAKTRRHCGYGRFLLDGEELRLRSAKA